MPSLLFLHFSYFGNALTGDPIRVNAFVEPGYPWVQLLLVGLLALMVAVVSGGVGALIGKIGGWSVQGLAAAGAIAGLIAGTAVGIGTIRGGLLATIGDRTNSSEGSWIESGSVSEEDFEPATGVDITGDETTAPAVEVLENARCRAATPCHP